jgi:hypothetical protein
MVFVFSTEAKESIFCNAVYLLVDGSRQKHGKEINQSSYDIWGAASHPPSKGSVTPQQCQYCTISPPPTVVNVPPVYTLSNFLFVSPGTQT